MYYKYNTNILIKRALSVTQQCYKKIIFCTAVYDKIILLVPNCWTGFMSKDKCLYRNYKENILSLKKYKYVIVMSNKIYFNAIPITKYY